MEKPTINIELEKLIDNEAREDYKLALESDIPAESMLSILQKFYSLKLSEYLNAWRYEDIQKLEWLLELWAHLKGKVDNNL